MKVFDRLDFYFLKFFRLLGLGPWYEKKENFRIFTRYTFLMFVGYLANIPLIFLFLDVFKFHWFIGMSLAAFIVHIAKFLVNKVWVFE